MKKLMYLLIPIMILVVSCCNNKPAEGTEGAEGTCCKEKKECCKDGEKKCCAEKKECCKEWADFENQTPEKKVELVKVAIEKINVCRAECEAKQAECKAKKAELDAKWATIETLDVDAQKALIDEVMAFGKPCCKKDACKDGEKKCCKGGEKKCCKDKAENAVKE
ncbi:MAG: hypothetical protein LBV69_08325 [Bacteroidales bacterium]|jgi:hypothetical protein|nr:hypothetical protein [Bacteroidales bacterium]